MEEQGATVKYLEIVNKRKKNQLPLKLLDKKSFDFIWFQKATFIKDNPLFVRYIKEKNIPIVLYNTYSPGTPYTEEMELWSKIDFLFVHNKEFYKFLKKNSFNAHYVPVGFYPEQYYKTINKKKFEVSFCGTALPKEDLNSDKRAIYIRSLSNFNTVVYGHTYKGKVGDIPVRSYKTHNEQRKIYSKTKINLDVPFFYSSPEFYKNKYHIKNRFFEIPATGNFLLTVRCPEFLDIFDENTVGYYDDNLESLKENVKRYLKDDEKREKMAEKAYKLVHQKHTFTHRFEKMFKILRS